MAGWGGALRFWGVQNPTVLGRLTAGIRDLDVWEVAVSSETVADEQGE